MTTRPSAVRRRPARADDGRGPSARPPPARRPAAGRPRPRADRSAGLVDFGKQHVALSNLIDRGHNNLSCLAPAPECRHTPTRSIGAGVSRRIAPAGWVRAASHAWRAGAYCSGARPNVHAIAAWTRGRRLQPLPGLAVGAAQFRRHRNVVPVARGGVAALRPALRSAAAIDPRSAAPPARQPPAAVPAGGENRRSAESRGGRRSGPPARRSPRPPRPGPACHGASAAWWSPRRLPRVPRNWLSRSYHCCSCAGPRASIWRRARRTWTSSILWRATGVHESPGGGAIQSLDPLAAAAAAGAVPRVAAAAADPQVFAAAAVSPPDCADLGGLARVFVAVGDSPAIAVNLAVGPAADEPPIGGPVKRGQPLCGAGRVGGRVGRGEQCGELPRRGVNHNIHFSGLSRGRPSRPFARHLGCRRWPAC